ncbi:hypothetical protein [Bifidobacterium favimelis]|uniref:Uncharacterized protein n=1 Tax=Bifidobacterium favimelis TaxID=3122979 RepID=A0ABU8ZPW8_9BIFI
MAKRKISEKQRRIYRRRRIVALILAALILAGLVWGAVVGVRAISGKLHQAGGRMASSIQSKTKSGEDRAPAKVPDCGPDDLALSLKTDQPTAPVGGAVTFTAVMEHKGSVNCLVDGSDGNRVLTIMRGEETIWRSDSCKVQPRTLLMSKEDKDSQEITWNADASGKDCQADRDLPRVKAGSYTALLVLKTKDTVRSQPVPIMIQ